MKKLIFAVITSVIFFNQSILSQQVNNYQLGNILSAYIDLKNALVNDQGDSARLASRRLFDSIDELKTDSMSVEQKKTWNKLAEKLSYDAEHIKGTNEIEHQREHFVSLSMNFYKVVKEFNNSTIDLYYQFCPMANDGKGAYWVSEKSNIANPYYGKKMLKCGSTKETLKLKE